jgi:hypothetical protein
VSAARLREPEASRLARAIRQRYARIGMQTRRAAFILLRARTLSFHYVHGERPFSCSPRLALRLAIRHELPALPRPARQLAAPVRAERFARQFEERCARRPSVSEHARPSRAADRGIDPPPAPPHPLSLRRVRPVELVCSKPWATAPVGESSASRAEAPPASMTFPNARAAPAAALPAPEVARLANEVLRAIDKRVVAHRERMGRR